MASTTSQRVGARQRSTQPNQHPFCSSRSNFPLRTSRGEISHFHPKLGVFEPIFWWLVFRPDRCHVRISQSRTRKSQTTGPQVSLFTTRCTKAWVRFIRGTNGRKKNRNEVIRFFLSGRNHFTEIFGGFVFVPAPHRLLIMIFVFSVSRHFLHSAFVLLFPSLLWQCVFRCEKTFKQRRSIW